MKKAGSASDPLWYKDAIIYEVHVRTFFDSSNDGVGDFRGLTLKLDYLQSLGITAIWLLPFYPSPLRDDGYDIANYEGIHPSYGTLKDFRTFLREAHRRGLQVITELVINHTSDQHPWFQAARRAALGSSKRDYYVWSDTDQRYPEARIIFTDSERSNWTWDAEAKAYYWHRFFFHQPDLNFDNPRVLRAVIKIMKFWFDMGVDGMRLDAIPYLIERDGTNCENLDETHAILKQIRAGLDEEYANRMLLAEANQWPADVRPYFGDGTDECHMAFHFPLMPRMFMALRQEDRHPITEILRQTPDIPEACQWALFLRNHDEMTLEMVTDEERDYMYQAYAADPQMRINVGIRRRLAPLMENSRRRMELMNSLLFSMPGTPVIYYGDEIGMGDNIYLGDRNGVRTPMQWTGDRNAGFSRADPARLYAPVIMDPVYGYQGLNVEAQERSPWSLLNWMKRMIALRKQHRTFGRGSIEFLQPHNRKVLAYIRSLGDEQILCVANLSRSVQPVELELGRFNRLTPVEMLERTEFPRIGELPYFLTLAPYGFYWFQLERSPAPVAARTVPQVTGEGEEAPPLLVGGAWDTLLEGSVRTLIERDLLLSFVARQRWFGGKARGPRRAHFVDWATVRRGTDPAFLTLVEVAYDEGASEIYFLPLALAGGQRGESLVRELPHSVLARLTGARKGVLYDGSCDDATAELLLNAIASARTFSTRWGSLKAISTSSFTRLRGPADAPLKVLRGKAEQSNTSLRFGDRFIMKLFRRLESGPNPDLEIGLHLTETVGFARVPALAGAIDYHRSSGETMSVAMLQQLVPSQADGWQHAIAEIQRFYERAESRPEADVTPLLPAGDAEPPPAVRETMAGYLETAVVLGRRTAEMHRALADDRGNPDFTPEPLTRTDLKTLATAMDEYARDVLNLLETSVGALPEDVAARAFTVLEQRKRLRERVRLITRVESNLLKTRVHGDYHLGQVLWAEGDFVILDFEGEPARSLAERRAKQSPLKDVAGMLRSFGYAAYAGLFTHTLNRPDAFARLQHWAELWRAWTASRFMAGYRATVGDAPFVPQDTAPFEQLLDAFVLDKALYELRYELNNRPDWVRIPLWGILPLLEE